MPANPRQRMSATRVRGACGGGDTGSPAHSGSRRSRVATAGHFVPRERRQRERRFQDPCGSDQVTDRPLEGGHRRRRGAEDATDRRRLRNVGLGRAVAVRHDHADVGGRERRVGERLRDRACQAVAVVADRRQALRFARVSAAQDLAQHRRIARRGGVRGLQDQRARALAEEAAVVPGVERPQHLGRQQSQPMVVEHHLRLDRRVVPDGDGAIGLAGAQRLERLDDGERSADAVIGDARVRTLEPVPDADVTEHVVGQRAQQPHRIDGVRELAPERGQLAVGRLEQREEIVLVLVIAAARADVDAGAVAVDGRRRGVERAAVGDDAGALDRAPGGVETDEIGAPDQLVQLAIVDQRARIEIGDLRRDPARPARGVPPRDRRDRRAPRSNGVEDFVRATCRTRTRRRSR